MSEDMESLVREANRLKKEKEDEAKKIKRAEERLKPLSKIKKGIYLGTALATLAGGWPLGKKAGEKWSDMKPEDRAKAKQEESMKRMAPEKKTEFFNTQATNIFNVNEKLRQKAMSEAQREADARANIKIAQERANLKEQHAKDLATNKQETARMLAEQNTAKSNELAAAEARRVTEQEDLQKQLDEVAKQKEDAAAKAQKAAEELAAEKAKHAGPPETPLQKDLREVQARIAEIENIIENTKPENKRGGPYNDLLSEHNSRRSKRDVLLTQQRAVEERERQAMVLEEIRLRNAVPAKSATNSVPQSPTNSPTNSVSAVPIEANPYGLSPAVGRLYTSKINEIFPGAKHNIWAGIMGKDANTFMINPEERTEAEATTFGNYLAKLQRTSGILPQPGQTVADFLRLNLTTIEKQVDGPEKIEKLSK